MCTHPNCYCVYLCPEAREKLERQKIDDDLSWRKAKGPYGVKKYQKCVEVAKYGSGYIYKWTDL